MDLEECDDRRRKKVMADIFAAKAEREEVSCIEEGVKVVR